MKNNTLKQLAQKAKKRLSTVAQNNEKKSSTKAYLSRQNYAIVVNKQNIEDDPLFEKVKRIMQKSEITNPLSELTDYDLFNSLSSADKEKYIIDISKRYVKIKEYLSAH